MGGKRGDNTLTHPPQFSTHTDTPAKKKACGMASASDRGDQAGEEVEAVGLLSDAHAERERRLDELRTTLERKDEDMEGLRGNIELMQQQMLLLREAALPRRLPPPRPLCSSDHTSGIEDRIIAGGAQRPPQPQQMSSSSATAQGSPPLPLPQSHEEEGGGAQQQQQQQQQFARDPSGIPLQLLSDAILQAAESAGRNANERQ